MKFEKIIPTNLSVVRTNDDTVWAEVMVSELEGNIITAIFLVMILVIASMGVRVGMLVGLSIPFCFLLTFIILKNLGIEFEDWHVEKANIDLGKNPPEGIFYNRMSASSHVRGHRYAPEFTATISVSYTHLTLPTKA